MGVCGSGLIVPVGSEKDSGIECHSCGKIEHFESFAGRALTAYLEWANHHALKDGGEEALITCPFCFEEGYIVYEKCCAICGHSCVHTCELCDCTIPASELSDGSFCIYCQHIADKD